MALQAPADAPGMDWRRLAWMLAPPLAVLLWRALLQAQADAGASGLQPLHPATLVSDPLEALWAAARPFVLGTLAVVGAAWASYRGLRAARRRHGAARVRLALAALWLLAWLTAGCWLGASHLNRAGRQTLPAQPVRVLLVRDVPASARGPGGAEVYVELPGTPAPMQLRAEGQPAAAFAPGSLPTLHTEAGRWWGRWGRLVPAAHGG